jgi:hypothetical protein
MEEISIIIASIISVILMIIYYLLRGKHVSVPVITLATDKSSYGVGETVALSGTVMDGGNPIVNTAVSIAIEPPSGDAYALPNVQTDSAGNFLANWLIPSDAVPGEYTANGSAVGATATATFNPRRGIVLLPPNLYEGNDIKNKRDFPW